MPAGSGVPGEVPSEGAPWRPVMLSGLKLWLRADMGITLNSGNVSAWADQSGSVQDFVQGTANKQPAWSATSMNGRPGITFDGSNDCLRHADFVYGSTAK